MARILVVDDEADNVKLAGIILRYNGHEIVELTESTKVIPSIPFIKPDLILLDIQMPYMNGYEICEKLREQYTSEDLKIVLFTALGQAVEEKARSVGADAVLFKPFSIDDLRRRVEEILVS